MTTPANAPIESEPIEPPALPLLFEFRGGEGCWVGTGVGFFVGAQVGGLVAPTGVGLKVGVREGVGVGIRLLGLGVGNVDGFGVGRGEGLTGALVGARVGKRCLLKLP